MQWLDSYATAVPHACNPAPAEAQLSRRGGANHIYAWSIAPRCAGLIRPRLSESCRNRTLSLSQVHASGMKVGLKNGIDMIEDVLDYFDFAVNEECIFTGDCEVSVYKTFVATFRNEIVGSPELCQRRANCSMNAQTYVKADLPCVCAGIIVCGDTRTRHVSPCF